MSAIAVCDEVRFSNKKLGQLTLTPLVVNFNKLLQDDVYSQASTSRSTSVSEAFQEDYTMCSNQMPTTYELLHGVACLYSANLKESSLQAIYKRLLSGSSKTLLLLRDGDEVFKEYIINAQLNANDLKDEFYLDSTSKLTQAVNTQKPNSSKSDSHLEPTSVLTEKTSDKCVSRSSTLSSEDISSSAMDWSKKTASSGFASDLDSDDKAHHHQPEPHKCKGKSTVSPNKTMAGTTFQRLQKRMETNIETLESKIRNLFEGSDSDESDEEISNEDEFGHQKEKLSAIMQGINDYLEKVWEENKRFEDDIGRNTLNPNQITLTQRLVASLTYRKDHSIPGTRVLSVDTIVVRKCYRNARIGTFLLQRLKCPSLVGPYDIITVSPNAKSMDFFRRNDFQHDVMLSNKFKSVTQTSFKNLFSSSTHANKSKSSSSTIVNTLFYLPPFNGNYTSLDDHPWGPPLNTAMSLRNMFCEIKRWRDKSLEAYEDEVCLVLRLKKEITRLHHISTKQAKTIERLSKENEALHNIISQTSSIKLLSTVDDLDLLFQSFRELTKLRN